MSSNACSAWVPISSTTRRWRHAPQACVVICRAAKPKERRKKILFINAVNEVTRERAQSYLTEDHIARVVAAYRDFVNVPGFARVATVADIDGLLKGV